MNLDELEREVGKLVEKRTRKDREWRKIWQKVFDHYTLHNLFRAILKANLEGLEGVVSLGKEAIVFKATTREGDPRAVKVYRVETSDFKRMHDYIQGDPRFQNVPKSKRKLVETWCQKEYKNLTIAEKAKIHAPKPYAFAGNVLVMQFIGDEWAAPLIKDVEMDDPESAFESVVDDMKTLYKNGLVHSDLSEFNILYWEEIPWLIDFAQGMVLKHPKADEFLIRDCKNITNFFSKRGVRAEWLEVYEFVKMANNQHYKIKNP